MADGTARISKPFQDVRTYQIPRDPNPTAVCFRASTSEIHHVDESIQEPMKMDETTKEPVKADDATSAPKGAPQAQAPSVAPPSLASPEKIEALKAKLAQVEARPNEYVKVLIELATSVPEPFEKVDYYRRAAELYSGKFGNHAEAVKAYEALVELEPDDVDAKVYLKEMYEKRRNYDALIALLRREADAILGPTERSEAYRQIAELATEKVKKPEVCIPLWLSVLDGEPDDPIALDALAQLYERGRDYEALCDMLERLIVVTSDDKVRVAHLTKLGQIAGERLKDDDRAAEAYRQLVALDPSDRRAQEQLKKRYTALGRWDDLESLYMDGGNWDEFIRLLEANEAKAETPERRIQMLNKVAELWLTQKGKPDRAARALEKVLSIDPENLVAAERLIPIYTEANNFKGLVQAIEVRLLALEPGVNRRDLLLQVANLYDERLRDKEKALARVLEAVTMAADDSVVLDLAEKAARAAGAWDKFVSAVKKLAADTDEPTVKNGLRLRLGRVLREELKADDAAIEQYRLVYDDAPDSAEALSALVILYGRTKRYAELLEAYQRKLELEFEPSERRATYLAIARTQRDDIEDAEAAVETLEALLGEAEDDREALSDLASLYATLARSEDQASILERQISLEDTSEGLAELKFRLAGLLEGPLKKPADALEQYREVLAIDVDHAGARAALEKMLPGTLGGEAAAVLETVFEQQEDWPSLARVLEVRAEGAVSANERVDILRKLAQLSASELGSASAAIDAQARALRADPTNQDTRLELENLAERSGKLGELPKIFAAIAQGSKDPELAILYWTRIAELEELASHVDEAVQALDQVLRLDPKKEDALVFQDRLLRQHGRLKELATVYQKRIALSEDPDVRESLFVELAELFDSSLGRPEEAVQAYQAVLVEQPDSRRALRALAALLARLERWDDLADNLNAQLGLSTSEEEHVELSLRLAALREQMGNAAEAVEGYAEILDRNPGQSAALTALERLIHERAHELRIAEILEPFYRSQGDYKKLTFVHEVQVKHATEPSRRVQLLETIAELHEDAGGDANLSFDAIARALSADPSRESILENLERLAARTGRFEDLASLLDREAGQVSEPDLKSRLLMAAAQLSEERVGDIARAIKTYRAVLGADPESLAAVESLERLFRAGSQFEELSKVLQQKALVLGDIESQKAALFDAAQLEANELQRNDEAVRVHEAILELDPEDLRSLDELISIFLAEERWKELLSTYSRKAEIVVDPDEKKQVLYEVGAVYEHELKDVPHAIDTYNRILELDPNDLTALGRLDVLYQATENWQELLGVLTHQADLTSDADEAIGHRYRVAALYEVRLGDKERAIELYREILVLQSSHTETLAALEKLSRDPKVGLSAAQVLETVYEASGDAEKLVSALSVQAQAADESYRAVEILERMAVLLEDSLGDSKRAFESLGRAVALEPGSERLRDNFERLAVVSEATGRASAIYDAVLEGLKDEPELSATIALRAATLFESASDDAAQAIERFEKVLVSDPENRSALQALDRLFEQTGNHEALAGILEKEAELGDTPDEILGFKFRLGLLKQNKLGDVPGAIGVYGDIVAAAPEHESAMGALEDLFASGTEILRVGKVLEPLYQASGSWEKLLEIREGEYGVLTDPGERLDLLLRMADESESQLIDVDRAFEFLVRATQLSPSDERVIDELDRLAPVVDEGWARLASAYADVLENEQTETTLRAETGIRLATVFEKELSDLARAEQTYSYVLDIAPADKIALENLDRIYTELEEWESLNKILNRRGPLEKDRHDRVGLYLRLGQLNEEKLARGQKTKGRLAVLHKAAESEFPEADDITSIAPAEEQVEAASEPALDDLLPVSEAPGDLSLESVPPASEPPPESEVRPEVTDEGATPDRKFLEDAVTAYRVVFDDLEPANEDASEGLVRVYSALENWTALAEVYKREIDNAVGDVAEADARAKLAHLSGERLGDRKGAIEGWKRVLDLRGEDPEALKGLALLYEAEQRWGELTDVLERHYDIADSDEDRVHVLTMRARLFDEQLNRDGEALENYQRVLDIDSSNVVALKAIASIFRRKKDSSELARALESLTDYAAPSFVARDRAEAYRELAILRATVLDLAHDAADAWRKVLEFKPGDFEALDRLDAYYRADENWEEVVGIKMQRAEALEESEAKLAEFLQVAELWKTTIGRYDSAREAFDKILSVDPLHEFAFKELEKLHTAAERWESLIELYLNRLEHFEEAPPRSDLLRRIARIFEERLDDKNQAFDALVNAFADDYFDDQTASQLERLAHATNRWNELLATANAWLQDEQERRPRIQLCLRLGKWYGEDLGMSNYAQPYYQQVLLIDPQNVRVMRQMAAIERLAGHYPKANQMLTKALDAAVSNDDRKLILTDLGDVIYRNLDQPDQAIQYYRRALEVDGTHRPALDALERIYEDRGQIQDLVDILAQKVGSGERPEEIVRQKLRLGSLLEERLGDPSGAARAYREALQVDAESIAALRGLERVLVQLKEWPELVKVLERQLDAVATEGERVQVLLKVAEVQEQQFLKPDLAAERLEQVVQIDPGQEQAYVALARCYRRLKRWPNLISALERHLDETTDRQTKLDLYLAMGAVFRDELGELDRAIDSYQSVVDAEPTHMAALEALSKLYERQGDAHRAVEYMTHVADLTTDGGQRVDMYYRIGRAMEEKLADRHGARDKFEQALDLDPSHLPSLAALRTIAIDEADWEGAADYLNREQERTESSRQRARLLVELGRIREDMLLDHAGAISAFERAIELDGDCEDAALALVREYVSVERYADAAPLAEMLVRRSRNLEREQQHMLTKLLGQVMSKLGEHEKAVKAFQTAATLDPTDHETTRGIADAAFALSDWATALTNYQRVLTSLGDEDVDTRAEVYFRLGEIKRAQGQDRQAINNYEKALSLDGEHRPTLDAMVLVHEKAGEYRLVAEYKRQILDSLFEGEARFAMLIEIGDLWAEREKNPAKAIDAYEEARDLKPEDLALLHRLLTNYQAAEEWQKMVDVLDSILLLETRGLIKAKLLYTQAQIYRDKLEDPTRAVELFNAALDLNPELLEAFERINKVLTTERNWKQLERSYRKMLHRLAGKGKPELEHSLWHQLGLIYRDRTGQTTEAIEAFRMSASLVPEAPVQRQILAELYETTEAWEDATREQRRLVESNPLAIEPYLALYRLALHKQAYDEAWCCASVISFLQKADEETERFFQDFRPQGMLPVTGRLGNEHWARCLFHPNENIHISRIFEMLVPAALQAKIAMLRNQKKLPQIDARFRQDPATSTVTFAKTFGWAAQVLGVATPPLYVRNDVQAYITALPTEPPSTVAGQLVLSGFQPQELTFICGKHLSLYRPEHFIKVLFPTKDELTVMLFAGVLLAAPQQPMPPDMDQQIRATAQSLAHFLQPVQLEGLKQVVKAFLADGARANVRRWAQGVELTACRAGLALSGDLEIARKIIGAEQQVPGEPTAAEKMKELLIFTVSEEYLAIRKALGIAVQA